VNSGASEELEAPASPMESIVLL